MHNYSSLTIEELELFGLYITDRHAYFAIALYHHEF